MSSFTLAAIHQDKAGSDIQCKPFSPSPYPYPHSASPTSSSHGSEGELEFDSDGYTSPNLKFSFDDWHAPISNQRGVEIEFDKEDGAQIIVIPSTSPFFLPPSLPAPGQSFSSECSFPSFMPTLSSRFDLFHSYSPLSLTDSTSHIDNVVVMDADSVLNDGLPGSIEVVREVEDKHIPDFPEDLRMSEISLLAGPNQPC